MTAKVIAIINQKGGPGKTTVSLNLGAELSKRGYNTGIVDADEQESMVEIVSLASPESPYPCQVFGLWKAGRKIHQEIKKYLESYDIIIIDCPPSANSPIAQSTLLVADLAIIPFVAGTIDALAAPKIRDAIEVAQTYNPELKAFVLLNRYDKTLNVTKQVTEILPQFGLPIFDSKLSERTAYIESPGIGNSVHGLNQREEKVKPCIKEIEALANEVLSVLNTSRIKNGEEIETA